MKIDVQNMPPLRGLNLFEANFYKDVAPAALRLALYFTLFLFCHTAVRAQQAPNDGSDNEIRWGEMCAGFQMSASVDVTNGLIHCRIRNATTNEMNFPSFDFGYFELISLEINGVTNSHRTCRFIVIPCRGYSSAFLYRTQIVQPGQIITNTDERIAEASRLNFNEKDFLKKLNGNTNLQERMRESFGLSKVNANYILSFNDTFDINLFDLVQSQNLTSEKSLEIRVIQHFRTAEHSGLVVAMSSPKLVLKPSLIEAIQARSREIHSDNHSIIR